jgi:hypothetical protein
MDGFVWSDERPFFDGKLQNGATYAIVYSIVSQFYPADSLGKPWFWDQYTISEDRAHGVVWGSMFPNAPKDRKHPCLQIENFQKEPSFYQKVRDKTGLPPNHPSKSDNTTSETL